MKTRDEIKADYASGKLKSKYLESIVYEEVFINERDKLADACAVAADIRREVIEERVGKEFAAVKSTRLDNCSMTRDGYILTGIENKIGAAMLPLGVAGPVRINGQYANGDYYLPLATNEAALIGGISRGIKAINMSGGVNTVVTYDGMTRTPLVEVPDLAYAARLIAALEDPAYQQVLAKCVQDPFVKLVSIKCFQLGNKVFPRIECKTGDAMGMNGVTKASADILRQVVADYPETVVIALSSNLCVDKKANYLNIILGRGKTVHASVFVPNDVLTKCFSASLTPKKIEKLVHDKCYMGSALAGTPGGYNVNAANAIAALYAATGQDLAHLSSSSSAFLQAEDKGDGVLFQMTFPQLEVAAMGGGTMFGTAKDMLRMIDCEKLGSSLEENDSVKRVAEVTATAAIALDINTTCTLANMYELASSHVRMARGEKD